MPQTLKLVQMCCYGGSKMLEHNIAVGAVNHLDLKDYILHIQGIKWEEPEHVRLFICGQEDEHFSLVQL